jgi:hypothetical protein
MEIKLIKNVLPKNFNKEIIQHLCTNVEWSLAFDYSKDRIYDNIFNKNQNLGFSYVSQDDSRQLFLNTVAKIVVYTIAERLNLKLLVERFMWNMYLPNQNSLSHKDREDDNYLSILYNLHDNDGGTEINENVYSDSESEAKVFKSNSLHRGLGPKISPIRFNLNIVTKYETMYV